MTTTSARIRLGCAAALILVATDAPAAWAQAPWSTAGWSTSSPTAQGLDPAPLDQIDSSIRAGEFGHIDRLVVVKNGYLVVDHEYENDYREISRGVRSPIGCGIDACRSDDEVHLFNYLHPDFHPFYQGREVHSLQSVTKSISATVIGAAIHRGAIGGVGERLLSFFDDYDLSRTDPRLERTTLRDLLTMRSGIEWHEQDRPFGPTNTTIQLEGSEDWIQFTLDQPMDSEPGEKWVYNSGGSHLMSGIVRKATGQFIDQYAETVLFGPLGIDDYAWKKTPRGYPDTEGGLYLEARQLAKIGYLYLQDGVWDGERLLPEGWAHLATERHVDQVNRAGQGYGYHWWRVDRGDMDVWAGQGFGGQLLLVIPQHDLVVVVNAWNLFGAARRGILAPLLDALATATGPA